MPPPDRRRYDEDDDRDPPRRPSTSPVLIVALVLGGVLVLCVGGCGLFMFLGYRAAEERAVQAEADVKAAGVKGKGVKGEATRVYTRQEFKDLVMGKTEDEVIAAVGKPDETTEDGDGIRWTYRGRVREPGPGKPNTTPVVVFREGKVAEVQY